MNNSFILTGLFMAGLGTTERQVLVGDTLQGNGFEDATQNAFDFYTVFECVMNQVLDLDSDEQKEWIDIIMNEGATPTISTVTGTACIAL